MVHHFSPFDPSEPSEVMGPSGAHGPQETRPRLDQGTIMKVRTIGRKFTKENFRLSGFLILRRNWGLCLKIGYPWVP